MTKPCPFCNPTDKLRRRVFYTADDWFAFLDGMPLSVGHTTLARRVADGSACPVGLNAAHLNGHDRAVADVVWMLRLHYRTAPKQPKDFLFGSLRQSVGHVHTHIVPLWDDQEAEWRSECKVQRGGMWRHLGWLESQAAAAREQRDEGQQEALEARLAEEAGQLRDCIESE